jgi:hypothetical protein
MLPALLDITIPAKLEAKSLRYRYTGFIVILHIKSTIPAYRIVILRIVIAILFSDHLVGPLCLSLFAKLHITHKPKLTLQSPAFWNGFLKPGNLQRDACDSTPGFTMHLHGPG